MTRNVYIVQAGHKVEYFELDDRYCWECLTCSSSGSSLDPYKAELRADEHAIEEWIDV